MELDISNDPEIERLGANATANHAITFWNQLATAARLDGRDCDPFWDDDDDDDDEYDDDNNDTTTTTSSLSSSSHTQNLTLTTSPTLDTRLYNRFRSNFPSSTYPVLSLSPSSLSGPTWSSLLEATSGQMPDYNFMTLLRRHAHDIFWMTTEDACTNLSVVSRAQWTFIELARLREGVCYGRKFRHVLQIWDLSVAARAVRNGDDDEVWKGLRDLKRLWPTPSRRALKKSGAGRVVRYMAANNGVDEAVRRECEGIMRYWKDLIALGRIERGLRRNGGDGEEGVGVLKRFVQRSYQSSTPSNPTPNSPRSSTTTTPPPSSQCQTTSNLSHLTINGLTPSESKHTFSTYGLLIRHSLLPPHQITALRTYGNTCLSRFQSTVLSPQGLTVDGDLQFDHVDCRQRPGHRVDNRYGIMEEGGPVDELSRSKEIVDLIKLALGLEEGEGYRILYGGIVHSFPGDDDKPPPPQIWHRDGPSLFSSHHHPTHCINIFIPLVDLTVENGCTEFLPGTHSDGLFAEHATSLLSLAATNPDALHENAVRPEMSMGGVVVFDIRVMHRGLRNKSGRERPVLYFTVARDWWTETHMFKNEGGSGGEKMMDESMAVGMIRHLHRSVVGYNDKSSSETNHDEGGIMEYGHPHYTQRFDLLLLEDIQSSDDDDANKMKRRGMSNITACLAFLGHVKNNPSMASELLSYVVHCLYSHEAHERKKEVLIMARKKRKQKEEEDAKAYIVTGDDASTKEEGKDFADITEDMSDVSALYDLLVILLFGDDDSSSSTPLQTLGFSRDRMGVYVMLALFKCYSSTTQLKTSTPSQQPPPTTSLPTHLSPSSLDETLTQWWHAGQSRFQFRRHSTTPAPHLLVVFSSLGSGLARPEWYGTLSSLSLPSPSIDILHVLDPAFSWYCQDPSGSWMGQSYYQSELNKLTTSYDKCMFLGDSMGGAAALRFCTLTNVKEVLVFTPQVDIRNYEAMTRKDFPDNVMIDWKEGVVSAVRGCEGRVEVRYGRDCEEDVRQVNLLSSSREGEEEGRRDDETKKGGLVLVPHEFDDHVLSLHLREKGELRGIVECAVERFLGR